MYYSTVGGCFRDLDFLKECTVFILHSVKLLHFQRLAEKLNQIRTQMWISQVFRWWSPCVLLFQTALGRPVSIYTLSGFDQLNSTSHHPANQTTMRWMAAHCQLKLFKRPEQGPVSMCEQVWCANGNAPWVGQRPRMQLFAFVFPSSWHVERVALRRYGSPRLSHRHTQGAMKPHLILI